MQNTFNGVLRSLVPAALAFFVGKGWIPESAVADIAAAVVAVSSALWSVYSNRFDADRK